MFTTALLLDTRSQFWISIFESRIWIRTCGKRILPLKDVDPDPMSQVICNLFSYLSLWDPDPTNLKNADSFPNLASIL